MLHLTWNDPLAIITVRAMLRGRRMAATHYAIRPRYSVAFQRFSVKMWLLSASVEPETSPNHKISCRMPTAVQNRNQWRRKVFSSVGGEPFARAPESAEPPLGAEGPLFLAGPPERMKGPEAPLHEKELPKGPLMVPKRTFSYRGSSERMARSSKHVRGPF